MSSRKSPASQGAPGSLSRGPSRPETRGDPARLTRLLERFFGGIAVIAFAIVLGVRVGSFLEQHALARELERESAALTSAVGSTRMAEAGNPPPGDGDAAAVTRSLLHPGGLIGRISVPRLGVSAMVSEGVDAHTLRLAAGHVPGTALPGEAGNVAIAAHRDTFFRHLGEVAARDTIRLRTLDGCFLYRVDSTLVVEPDRVDLLAPTREPTLTMITCYPFHYIGPAPRRFVVRATQVRPPA